jgi:HAE1 family hydrophobic/amphiphilic exporter-1
MQLTRRGMPRREAIVLAGKTRLRPILMTSISLIMGMLPLALALSEVGRFRQAMGIAIIGGLISSTALTLLVIPSLYEWVDDLRMFFRRLFRRPPLRKIDLDEAEENQVRGKSRKK